MKMSDSVEIEKPPSAESAEEGEMVDIDLTKDASNDTTKGKSKCCANTKQFFLYDSAREEIQAFYYNQFGRSVLFISFMFLSLAILELANQQAGCPQTESGGYENCGKKVYGMQPSSMLALMAIIGGVATSCFMPYAGAVVDYSDHRLAFGRVCAILLVLVNFVQIFIFESTWFAMTILQAVVAAATFMGNSMVLWSYVNAPNDHDLHGITSSGRLWETFGMLGFFIVVGVVGFTSGWDSVNLARFSQGLASLVGGITLFLAYKRYKPVKAVKYLESGSNLYVAGVRELWNTIKTLGKTEPGAQRFLFALMFVEAAMSGFTNLAITYLSEQIQMGGTAIIIFIMVNFVTNPIGVIIHRSCARKVGHKRNYLMVVTYVIVLTGIFVGTISGPQHSNVVYIFSVLYGIAYGWYFPSNNGYYVSLVPKERVTELWGFNMFAGVILSWAPPVIFTALNESTGNLRLGLIGIIIFLLVGLCIAFTIPVKAQKDVADDTDEEKGEGEPAAENEEVSQEEAK